MNFLNYKNVIYFCKNKKCCPEVRILEDDTVVIGGEIEGWATFTKENFKDLVDSIKNGDFDFILE